MRMMFGATLAAGLTLAAAPAMAATTVVDFNFLAGATILASGEFTYDSAKTGTIGWDDLDSFSIDVLGVGYDLAFVNSGGFGEFRYLGWDTAGHHFVSTVINSFPNIMSAIKEDGSNGGFFIREDPVAHIVSEYSTANYDNPYDQLALDVSTVGGATPEPASWALLIAGFGGLGAVMRRRRSVALAA